MKKTTDFILVRCRSAGGEALVAAASAWCRDVGLVPDRVASDLASALSYVYARMPDKRSVTGMERDAFATAWMAHAPSANSFQLSRLELVFDAPGHSLGVEPMAHYVVEMDPETGWRDELERWYDTEHMPGLATVPGTVRAQRLLNHDVGPLSLARYDLVGADTLNSPPWLAVRATRWSDRVRPHFTNARRTMFQCHA